jgi:hypothetical protein
MYAEEGGEQHACNRGPPSCGTNLATGHFPSHGARVSSAGAEWRLTVGPLKARFKSGSFDTEACRELMTLPRGHDEENAGEGQLQTQLRYADFTRLGELPLLQPHR